MDKIKTLINILFKRSYCKKCSSTKLNKGYWTRGWNNLCNQASGAKGTRCYDCGYILWDIPYDEYIKLEVPWCTVYKDQPI